ANGPVPDDGSPPSLDCCEAAVKFLLCVVKSGTVLLDLAGEIECEYRRYLHPSGQPGVGDRFLLVIQNSAPDKIERIDLPKRDDGEFVDLPQALIDARFDPSDRKFAALATRGAAPVINATDSDWLEHRAILDANGIRVEFVCGCDKAKWFSVSTP
ncbi:MAG: hypothetical protein MUE49_13450, partial [Rhodospirillales bacterium]|nr:hypothetical protein [Rhodospirillales bacterium]